MTDPKNSSFLTHPALLPINIFIPCIQKNDDENLLCLLLRNYHCSRRTYGSTQTQNGRHFNRGPQLTWKNEEIGDSFEIHSIHRSSSAVSIIKSRSQGTRKSPGVHVTRQNAGSN